MTAGIPESADVVIVGGGIVGRDVGGWVHSTVPLHAAEHSYLVTEPVNSKDRHDLRGRYVSC
jgi:hypothetical protein